ncbi:translesion DNA synthesis-associated protein ImuA [Salinivibrio proteolyticus]|uniref:Translesion DNA synthesis-associated protein ImuA n=1 Tax=Salinivibrio proteolyticus TaxID=334715 RepID=A0ABY7LB41_9GAMM|nr:translesion DNA synthesis-associated protein ImuA [Salinivibrio proteolyticus]WBA14448.1 translesion DNA synthesis-associated protein ImuA [Salinivibrio proteolyticus]
MMKTLDQLAQQHGLWRASQRPLMAELPDKKATGYSAFDQRLGGLPSPGVTDIISDYGVGELRLVLPALYHASGQQVAWIRPPVGLNAAMLHQQGYLTDNTLLVSPKSDQDALWAAEQAARSGACQAVVLWPSSLTVGQVKRLKLAAEHGQCAVVLLRRQQTHSLTLPVDLSVALAPSACGVTVTVRYCRGQWPPAPFTLDWRTQWPALVTWPSNAENLLAFPSRQQREQA